MKRAVAAANPPEYLASIVGWRRVVIDDLRRVVCSHPELEEVVKWGHLVYLFKGPVCLIRAEEARVLFGFWRGQRLRHIEPRLRPGGKYEMASIDLREGMAIDSSTIQRLVREAVELNRQHGDPASAAKR